MSVRARRIIRGVLGLGGLAVLFEAAARAGLVDPRDVPPASTVLARATGLVTDAEFLGAVAGTLTAWASGLALAVLFAVPLGMVLGSVPRLDLASRVVVEFLRPIPSVALIPVAILVYGSGNEMKTALIVYAASWPILLNTLYGLRDVDPVARDALRAYGFGRLGVLWWLDLPSAAPFAATGVRISAAIALVVAVGAEVFAGAGSDPGIGSWLREVGFASGATELMLAGAVWAGVIGVAINVILVSAERRIFRWREVTP